MTRKPGTHSVDACDRNGNRQSAETCGFAWLEPTYKSVTAHASYRGEAYDTNDNSLLRISSLWNGLSIQYVIENCEPTPVTIDWKGAPQQSVTVGGNTSVTLNAVSTSPPEVLGTRAELSRSGSPDVTVLTVPTLVAPNTSIWATRGIGCHALAGPRSLRRHPAGRFAYGTTSALELHAEPTASGLHFLQLGSRDSDIALGIPALQRFHLLMTNDFGSIGPLPADAAGLARFPIVIPNQLGLLGVRLHVQGLAFAPITAEISLSNAGLIGVGF